MTVHYFPFNRRRPVVQVCDGYEEDGLFYLAFDLPLPGGRFKELARAYSPREAVSTTIQLIYRGYWIERPCDDPNDKWQPHHDVVA